MTVALVREFIKFKVLKVLKLCDNLIYSVNVKVILKILGRYFKMI